jgi:uncharacterized protein
MDKIITDILYIKAKAAEREEENVEFRTYLKYQDLSSEKIDAIVHDILADVTAQIDCTKCGNCCEKIRPTLDDEDIRIFAEGLGLPENQFRTQYLIHEKNFQHKIVFNTMPCPFLEDRKCVNYDNRPKECRSYPHLHKADITGRLLGILFNYEICPIVFNVYERLKAAV